MGWHIEEGRREGKCRRCCYGDILYSIPCHSSCFAPGWFEEKDELHQDDMKKRINCPRMIWRLGCIPPILQIVMHGAKYVASAARNLINSVPQTAVTTFFLHFWINPSSLRWQPPTAAFLKINPTAHST